jgi:hypothetical protein
MGDAEQVKEIGAGPHFVLAKPFANWDPTLTSAHLGSKRRFQKRETIATWLLSRCGELHRSGCRDNFTALLLYYVCNIRARRLSLTTSRLRNICGRAR